jgi:hypothetical protein
MNKLFLVVMIILFVFWLCMGFYIFTSIAKGDHLEQEIPTQSNKQTDLFDDSIDNLLDFTSKLEAGKQVGIDSMGGEHGNPQGLQYITKKSKGELVGESSKLESIHENDLATKGREEMIKNDSLNELYTDYSRPLNKQHLKDAKTIANAQDELLGNLLEKLKDLGVDCKTIKGDKKIEPEYFLQTKTSNHKDTLYNQTFCEELRNTYNCDDIVTLTCKKVGIRFKNPEARKINLDGHWLHHNKNHWGYAWKWERKRWGWYIHPHHFKNFLGLEIPLPDNSAVIIADARAHIANHLGVSIEQIGEHVEFPAYGRGIGNINPVGCRWRVAWDFYEFSYTYRESYKVCEEWSEDWNERCRIK